MKIKSSPVFFALFILLASSAHSGKGQDAREIIKEYPNAGKIIPDVPFIKQKRYDCGPASVAMVLRYYGKKADPDEIAERFETEAVAGTFTVDLLIAATSAGMEAHWVEGDLSKLEKEIDNDRPVIVFLNLAINPLPARHFAVAVGYLKLEGRECVVLHSGEDPWLMVPLKKFKRQWKRTGNMMMTLSAKTPREGREKKEEDAG